MRWLYLHFPRLALDSLLAEGDGAGCWVLLDPANRLLQCNDEALAAGLRPGLSLGEALALADRLEARRYDPAQALVALQRLAACCYLHVAQIHLDPPAGLWLELASMVRMHGDVVALSERMVAIVAAQGYHLYPVLAEKPYVARLLARAGLRCLGKNDGAIATALQQLALSDCDLSDSTLEQLQGMGLQQLGQVMALATAELRRRCGSPLAEWLASLSTGLPPAQSCYQPPRLFDDKLVLLYEAATSDGLLFVLQRQLQRLQLWLRSRQLAATELWLELGHRQLAPTRIRLASGQPESEPGAWLLLARLQWERLPLLAPVISIRLMTGAVQPLAVTSDDLWQRSEQRLSMLQLLGRLQARLSEDSIWGLRSCGEHSPELAWQRVSAGAGGGDYGRGERPLWLLPEPLPLTESWPICDGPERLVNGWWAQPIQRDYYVATATDGRPAWIFRAADGRWYLHGWFG